MQNQTGRVPQETVDAANLAVADVIGRYVQLKKSGPEFKACCPFHNESTPSFTVVPAKQMWHCFGCGKGGDAVSFVQEITGAGFRDAVEIITGKLPDPKSAIDTTGAGSPTRAKWQHAGDPPDSAPVPDFRHYRLGTPTTVWTYRNADAEPIGYVARFPVTKPDGEIGKETLPMCWAVNTETGEFSWRWLSFGIPRPLYNLPALTERPKARVMIVEGEKTRDAAAALFPSFVVLSWPGGGKAVKHADFSPLAGRKVTLWPDADQPGTDAMRAVWEAVRDIAAEVRIVPAPAGAPDGWDLADPWPLTDGDPVAYAKSAVVDAAAYFAAPEPDNDMGIPISAPEAQPDEPPTSESSWASPLDIFAEFPAPPIREDMLPDSIAAYARECSELIGVDPSMIAIPAIVACAAALHDGIQIQPKRHETSWTESARLWCAIVGSPSIKKSPAIRRATKRLRKIDADLAETNAKLAADYAEQTEQFKDAKKEAKKSGGLGVPAPERPAMARMIVEDITVEALSEVLKDNPRGIMCIQDELSGWFGAMDAYSGGKSGNKDRAAWLQAYNGGFRQVDRIMRGAVHIPNFSVCMIGGIQPDAIRKIAGQMTDDGLMQRFMIVVGHNAPELDRVENKAVGNAFSALIERLHSLMPADDPVKLSEAAHGVRERLMAYAGEMAEYGALPGGLRSHLGKWSGLFARLLLTYHAIECAADGVYPTSRKVAEHTAHQVDQLMRRFLLPHALAYYSDILGANTELEHARWIGGYALSRGVTTLTNRDLMQSYKAWRGMDDWKRQRVMQVLEDMGWLVPMADEDRQSKRGASVWIVNPRCHRVFAEKAIFEAERREKLREEVALLQSRPAN